MVLMLTLAKDRYIGDISAVTTLVQGHKVLLVSKFTDQSI